MSNRDIQAAWKYHEGTRHSYWSIRNNPHFLDWSNRPLPFKIYLGIEMLQLTRDVPQTGVAALSPITHPVPPSEADSVPDLQDVTRILCFSAGITKQRTYPGGEVFFRAAACTGTLYEIELYVVTGDLPGLDAGVYHFNPADVTLARIILEFEDKRSLLCYKHGVESLFGARPEASSCLTIAQHSVGCFQEFLASRWWRNLISEMVARMVALCC